MRVFLMLGAALAIAACSDAPTSSSLAYSRRSAGGANEAPAAAPAGTSTPKGSTPGKPSSEAPTPPNTSQAPASDAGAPNQSPAPEPGSCQAPQCLAGGGMCGCKATNAAGALVVMGCQDGACACQGGITDTQFDGDCNSIDDAQQLFFANCLCD